VEVDDIGTGDTTFDEGNVIVFDRALAGVEVGLIAQALGGGVDQVEQPGRAVGVADDVEVGITDHVHHHERFDLLERAVSLPLLGEMARTVKTVGIGPGLDGFFAVGPDQPDAVAIALFSRSSARTRVAQLVGVFEQDGGGRAAVVGAYEPGIAQRVDRVVVAEDDDDAVLGAGKFRDDVADGKFAFHSVGGEDIVFDLIAFEVVENVALKFFVILVAHVALAEGGDFSGVLEGAPRIDVRERGGVGSGRFGRRRLGNWSCGGGAAGVGGGPFGAGYGVRRGNGQ